MVTAGAGEGGGGEEGWDKPKCPIIATSIRKCSPYTFFLPPLFLSLSMNENFFDDKAKDRRSEDDGSSITEPSLGCRGIRADNRTGIIGVADMGLRNGGRM